MMSTEPYATMGDRELVEAAVVRYASRYPRESRRAVVARFARDVMVRDERTVRRWLTGEIAVPQVARDKLVRWLDEEDGCPRTTT